MKLLSRILTLLVLATLGLFYTGCKGGDDDDDTPVEQVQLEKLSKTWKVESVTYEDNIRTDEFTDFTITFSGAFNSSNPSGPYNFSVGGERPTPSPWPPSDTFTFGSPATSVFITDDGINVNYSFVGENLKLEFTCTECSYVGSTARVNEVNGDWVFLLKP